jgi:hypothetical protein
VLVNDVATTTAPDSDALAAAGLTGTNVFEQPGTGTIAPLAGQAAAGALTVEVTTVLPLGQAADGLATIAAGKASGKIVVTINSQGLSGRSWSRPRARSTGAAKKPPPGG